MKLRSVTVVTFLLLAVNLQAMADDFKYPITKEKPVSDIVFNIKITDPFRWLDEEDDPAVKEWVAAQNKFTQSVLADRPGREQIRKRLSTLLEIGSLGTPQPVKGRYFYTKREGVQNQPVLYVRSGLKGDDQVVVDPNLLSKEGTIALDWWFPSDDGKLVAYGLSKDGSEQSVLHVRDVANGKDLAEKIERTRACSVAWLPDSTGFYYTRYPAVGSVAKGQENYFRHVYLHTLGADPRDDVKVFGEGRKPEDWLAVQLSPDGRWLAVTAYQGWARSEIYLRDNKTAVAFDSKGAGFVPLVEGIDANFDATLRNDAIYVHTNHEAPRYRFYRVDPARLDRKAWDEVIPQGKDKLESVAIIGDNLVAKYMHNACTELHLLDTAGKLLKNVALPTLGTVSGLGGEWDGDELFYSFNSFTIASSVYRVDLKNRSQELWGRVDTGIDPEDFTVEQVKYRSKDNTEITMFLAHKKGIERNGNNPTLLYGYGGFNISLTPTFSASRFLFLQRGGVLAIPNLRGGGEYGEDWHRAGMLENKQNTFSDFIAAAEWLIDNKFTNTNRLAIQGGSNGGLLVGATVTQRPDLFRAVVCQVPLLDMIRYHKYLIARLWIPEYGSSDNEKQFEYLLAYSPYHNVKDKEKYPAMLFTTAAADTRVDPSHARKMAAKIQAASISGLPVLLRQETRAGHGAGKPRSMQVEELTDVYSFLFWQLGMEAKQ